MPAFADEFKNDATICIIRKYVEEKPLLRYMLTGSKRETPDVHIGKPLAHIIKTCTAFAPKERFTSAKAGITALLTAKLKAQKPRKMLITVCSAAVIALCVFGGVKWYQYATFNSFAEGAVPRDDGHGTGVPRRVIAKTQSSNSDMRSCLPTGRATWPSRCVLRWEPVSSRPNMATPMRKRRYRYRKSPICNTSAVTPGAGQ